MHTHAFEASFITPRLAITSPQKGCGKTTVLDLLSGLVPKPLQAANVTRRGRLPHDRGEAADTARGRGRHLPGARTRSCAACSTAATPGTVAVIRVVEHEGDFEPRQFSTWAPVAIAKIGKLPGTLEDRSIKLEMRRGLPGEVKQRLRRDRLDQFQDLARRCARWAADNMATAGGGRPHHAAVGRQPPRRQLAPAARDRGLRRGRVAAEGAQRRWRSEQPEASDSALAVMLLADLRDLFAGRRAGQRPKEKLSSSFIVAELAKLEHRPWPELPRQAAHHHASWPRSARHASGSRRSTTMDGNFYHRMALR